MEHSGWLTKNGDRRFCVLANGELAWALKPMAKPKNAVALAAFALARVDARTLRLTPPTGKDYELVAADQFDSAEWEAALRSWSRATSAVDVGPSRGQRDLSKMSGWLLKKGKKRWFWIDAGVLHWAAKAGTDRAHANGSLELRDCSITRLDPTIFELTSSVGANYTLSAALGSEVDQWIDAVLHVLHMHGMSREDALGDKRAEHRGYLLKKGQRRFLLLKSRQLLWYVSEHESTPKGSLQLARCTAALDANETSFRITTSDYKEWTFHAKSADEAREWVDKIKAAATKAKRADMQLRNARLTTQGSALRDTEEVFFKQAWVKKNNKARVLQLRGNTLLWYEKMTGSDDPSNSKNSVPLAGAEAKIDDDDTREVIIIDAVGALRRFCFTDSPTAAEWAAALSQACARADAALRSASKKGEARISGTLQSAKRGGAPAFYMLGDAALNIYASEADASSAQPPLECLPLASCKVEVEAGQANIVLREATGQQRTLTCASAYEARAWHTALLSAIAEADRALQPDRVFGVPLVDVDKRLMEKQRGPLPLPLAIPLDWLGKHGLQTEGVLRLTGDIGSVESYREMFDRGMNVSFPPSADAHDVAGVAKLWLRELPEPLLTFELYDYFLALVPNASGHGTSGDESAVLDALGIAALVERLPAINQRVLRRLLRFAMLLVEHAETTKMTVKNCAIVLGPTLLRPSPTAPDAQMREMSDAPLVQTLTRALITQYFEIFGAEEALDAALDACGEGDGDDEALLASAVSASLPPLPVKAASDVATTELEAHADAAHNQPLPPTPAQPKSSPTVLVQDMSATSTSGARAAQSPSDARPPPPSGPRPAQLTSSASTAAHGNRPPPPPMSASPASARYGAAPTDSTLRQWSSETEARLLKKTNATPSGAPPPPPPKDQLSVQRPADLLKAQSTPHFRAAATAAAAPAPSSVDDAGMMKRAQMAANEKKKRESQMLRQRMEQLQRSTSVGNLTEKPPPPPGSPLATTSGGDDKSSKRKSWLKRRLSTKILK